MSQELFKVIEQIQEYLIVYNNEDELDAWNQIMKWMFGNVPQCFESELQQQFLYSGCENLDNFIDLLLFRIDNNCDIPIEINYNINEQIILEQKFNEQVKPIRNIELEIFELGKQVRDKSFQ